MLDPISVLRSQAGVGGSPGVHWGQMLKMVPRWSWSSKARRWF